jgi:hypothetical protein
LPDLVPSTELTTIDKGRLVWRVYRADGPYPTTWNAFRSFGPVMTGRFDHHEPPPHDDPGRGILYGAMDIAGALIEAFQDSRVVDRTRREPWLVGFELEFDLVALDLRGAWPTRAGASQAISSGRRDIARGWSRAIYAAYPSIQALVHPSAMAGGSVNLALYERASQIMPMRPRFHAPLTHPGLLDPIARIAARHGYGMR